MNGVYTEILRVPVGRKIELVVYADKVRGLTAHEVNIAQRFIALLEEEPPGLASLHPAPRVPYPPKRVVVVRPKEPSRG